MWWSGSPSCMDHIEIIRITSTPTAQGRIEVNTTTVATVTDTVNKTLSINDIVALNERKDGWVIQSIFLAKSAHGVEVYSTRGYMHLQEPHLDEVVSFSHDEMLTAHNKMMSEGGALSKLESQRRMITPFGM